MTPANAKNVWQASAVQYPIVNTAVDKVTRYKRAIQKTLATKCCGNR